MIIFFAVLAVLILAFVCVYFYNEKYGKKYHILFDMIKVNSGKSVRLNMFVMGKTKEDAEKTLRSVVLDDLVEYRLIIHEIRTSEEILNDTTLTLHYE